MIEYAYDEKTGRIEKISKGLLRSKTVWGGILASFPIIWNSALEALPHISEGVDVVVAAGILDPKTTALVSMIGGLLAIFGRVKADRKIKGVINNGD